MADDSDTLSENIIINDAQALADLDKLVTGVTSLNDKFIMLLGTLGQTNGQLNETAGATEKVTTNEKDATESTNAFTAAMQKAGIALTAAFGLGAYQIVTNTLNLIKGGIQDGLDFAQSMYLINSAVSQMRDAGVDVQFQDLSNIVTDLGPKLQVFSNLDVSKVVGQVAALGGQFGMTAQQVSDLSEVSLIAQERLGTDAVTNASKITASILNITNASSRQILQNLGLQVNAQEIYNEAVQLGLDNGAKSYALLSDEAKVQAGMAIIDKQLAGLRQDESAYLDTAPGKVKSLSAEWTNLWTGWGIAITNIMPVLTQFFTLGVYALAAWSGTIQAIIDIMNGMSVSNFVQDALNRMAEVQKLYSNPSPSQVTGAPSGLSNTPLGTPPTTGALSPTDQAKVEADMEKEIISLHDSEAAALEKIQTDLGNKLIDIKTKYDRALVAEDVTAANDARKIAQDLAETLLVDAEKKRLDDIEAQQKYYEELANLRNQFELNLEDALRSRDAKTIIHLIEQYDLSKQEKAQQYKDEIVIRNENYQQEIDLAKQQEQYKLVQLNQEVAQRKAALAVQYQNEVTDAKTNAERQATAEQVDIANRIIAWEDGLKLQYTITDTQMKNIYNNINAYLGKNGYVDSVYTYIIERMMQVYAAMSSLGGTTTTPADTPLGYGHGRGMASGGSLFANRPTSVTFGEAGPELAMFMPLGSGVGHMPSASFAGGSGGSIQLQVTLDKNLEAQIVDTTLNNVALQIDRMQKS